MYRAVPIIVKAVFSRKHGILHTAVRIRRIWKTYRAFGDYWLVLAKSYYDGLTILGGEPFELSNQRELVKLIRRLRKELPDRNIWMYTGFTYDKDLVPGGCRYIECTDEILDSIDMLVDGRFIEELKNITLTFRGSENQRIIDMKQTREQGKVVLSPLMQKKHR